MIIINVIIIGYRKSSCNTRFAFQFRRYIYICIIYIFFSCRILRGSVVFSYIRLRKRMLRQICERHWTEWQLYSFYRARLFLTPHRHEVKVDTIDDKESTRFQRARLQPSVNYARSLFRGSSHDSLLKRTHVRTFTARLLGRR